MTEQRDNNKNESNTPTFNNGSNDLDDVPQLSNDTTQENQNDENLKPDHSPNYKGNVSKQTQTNSLLELSTQKLVSINHNNSKDRDNFVSLEVVNNNSTDSGVLYKFYKNYTENDNVAKAEAFIYMTIPPDGGYAWLILLTAFLCQAIVDGILFSIGILLPHIAAEMSLSYKQTALVASTQIGIYCFTAPLGSAFINKFGFRPVAITGSLISSTAIFIASFSQGIFMLVFFYGIIAGPAMGIIGVSTSLIINYYFERFRAVVGGVASSGSGVGVITVSLLNIEIVEKFGWRIAARIHVILLLIASLLACTYREVKPTRIGQFVESITDDNDSDEETICSTELASDRYSVCLPSDLLKNTNSTLSSEKNMDVIPECPTSEEAVLQNVCPCCMRKKSSNISDEKRLVLHHDPLDRDDIFYDGPPDYSSTTNFSQRSELGKMEVFDGNEERIRTVSYTLSVIRRSSQTVEKHKFAWIPKKIKSVFYALFDLQLLKKAEFRLLLLESFFFPMGFNIPFIYSTERAQIDEDYANLLPVVIGLTNVIFRISVGFVAYKIKFHTAYLAGSGMLLGGIVTLLSGFVGQRSEIFQFSFALCFGIAAASYSALRAIIYVKVLGLERLTNAFGLTTMVMGVGVFIGTNVAGILNDLFVDYWVSFVFSGTCMTIAGLMKLCIPKYVEYRREMDADKFKRKVRFAKESSRKKNWWQKYF